MPEHGKERRVDSGQGAVDGRVPVAALRRRESSWRIEETYVRVKGWWKYLYRAIHKDGATLDFFSPTGATPRLPSASFLPP
jgi:DDE domain